MAESNNIFGKFVDKLSFALGYDEYVLSQDRSLNIESSLKVRSANIQWRIKNFNYFDLTSVLESPVFRSEDKKFSWFLKIYRNTPGIFLTVELVRADGTENILPPTRVSFSLINSHKEKEHCFNILYNEGRSGNLVRIATLLDPKNNLIYNNSFTLLCELNILEDFNHKTICTNEDIDNKIEDRLLRDFTNMMKNPNFSDVTLEVGEKKFRLHKVVLAARSPVFAAMFKNKMKESMSKEVKITSTPPGVMQEVIRYIYTGKTPNLTGMAGDLFKAADFYDLQNLKERCLMELQSQLKVENAVYTLDLMDTYNEAAFKKEVLNYIASNEHEVIKTEQWKELTTSKPHLLQDIYKASIERNSRELKFVNPTKNERKSKLDEVLNSQIR